MIDGRWLKIIDENGTKDINEYINNFIFLDAKASYPVSVEDSITMKGVDGELPGVASFAPFNLVVKFGFDGIDEIDINLMEQKLRSIFYKRTPYYIVTSDNPGIKYKVNNPDMNPDYADFSTTRFEMTFSVKDGYSESLKDTSQFSLSSGDWQFEAGVLSDDEIKYTHETTAFKIYNGSSDTINPLLRHRFKLLVNIDAPKGFKLNNKTTGDVFEYKKGIKKNQQLVINGVHPFINNKRVGIDTNWQWLTLAKGFNDIEITGENIKEVKTQWIFPFIYR
ncbi:MULTISPECIES: phage tail domain-containing protein [Staphylococcus]|uniref:phage tail domain-containing protein n=1 Tax=Staphylococcus TaxID=1279 RepID=UPI0008A99B35|nr:MULTISPECIES: phage tail domain-containing protein [Staphylococcus]OHS43418.1 phage tail protein [Staphylococcus sp. HMSC65H10]VED60508.1 phage tail family protein [Staphylococcus simulans]